MSSARITDVVEERQPRRKRTRSGKSDREKGRVREKDDDEDMGDPEDELPQESGGRGRGKESPRDNQDQPDDQRQEQSASQDDKQDSPKLVDEQSDGPEPNPPELGVSNQDDDALLEVELPPSTSAPLFDYDEPPSPASSKQPFESGALPPVSSSAKPHSFVPMVSSVEMPDPKPTSDNPASSEKKRRTIKERIRTVFTKHNHNRTPRQTPSGVPPQSAIASQTKATPLYEKRSTMVAGRRKRVIAYRHPAERQARPRANPFMNLITYLTSQKKAAPRLATVTPDAISEITPHPEPGPASVSGETKADSSGAQNKAPHSEVVPVGVLDESRTESCGAQNDEVRVYFVCLAAEGHDSSCSRSLGA
ncbi:hypothetical protein HD554DRAFT_2106054 [Boletus coccyginus]|nr:hypothetical protein HD554DRAFT_2106054 [Boletus coccyginus]